VLDPFPARSIPRARGHARIEAEVARGATMAEAIECVAYGLDRKAKGARP
jgi:conjugal transfer ATP-binding protein TraC